MTVVISMLGTTIDHLRTHTDAHDEIRFVLFGADTLAVFTEALAARQHTERRP